MKYISVILAIVSLSLAQTTPIRAQAANEKIVAGPVSTGAIVSLDRAQGIMVIKSAENGNPITFYGMDKALVETNAGRVGNFADLQPQMSVTVEYKPINGRWHVGKVIIPSTPYAVPVPAVGSELTAAERKALESKAANDGDITTKPGVKARIDNDITTQPGKKDPRDPDITKKTDR